MRVTLFHTGFAEYVMGLGNALADHAEVTIIHPESLHEVCQRLANPGVRLQAFAKPPLRRQLSNLPAMHRAFRLIEQTRPDVVHVQEACDYAYDALSLVRRWPALVTTIHDVTPHPGDGDAAPGLQYSKAIGIWRSHRLIVHTDGMRDALAARFRVDPERIDVIAHGELGSLYRRLAQRAGRSPVHREPHTLLFFGRIWAYKGLRYLLEAFERVRRELPDARLLICGRGRDLDANRELIDRLDGIEIDSSYVPVEAVAGLFERSAAVVLPYVEASQSGVSAVAFTIGTVVVASRVGGLAEQLDDGHTAVLVPPRDVAALAEALIALLKDSARQQAIRSAAFEFGTGALGWQTIAGQTLACYRRALSRRASQTTDAP